MEEYVNVGYTKKAFGVKGEIKLLIEDHYLDDCLNTTVLFIELQGKQVPFFIEYLKEESSLIVKFEEIDSKEATNKITGKILSLRASDTSQKEAPLSNLQFAIVEGFTMIDQQLGEIGVIETIEEYPQQEIAMVKQKDQILLIPLNEAFITAIDEKNKVIEVNLPQGLVNEEEE